MAQTVMNAANSGTCPRSSVTALDLSQGFSAPSGYTVQAGLQNAPHSLALKGTTLTYTPPTGFSSNPSDGSESNGMYQSLNYRLILTNSSTNQIVSETSWTPLTIPVRANVSFSSVVKDVFQSISARSSRQCQSRRITADKCSRR